MWLFTRLFPVQSFKSIVKDKFQGHAALRISPHIHTVAHTLMYPETYPEIMTQKGQFANKFIAYNNKMAKE